MAAAVGGQSQIGAAPCSELAGRWAIPTPTCGECMSTATTARDGSAAPADRATRAGAAAVDRYHAAFENGSMDDTTARPRLRELHHQITQLTARRDELADAIASQPQPPPPATHSSPKSASPRRGSSPCSESPSPEPRSPANPPRAARRPRFTQWTVQWS